MTSSPLRVPAALVGRRRAIGRLLASPAVLATLQARASDLPGAVNLQREIADAAARGEPLVLMVTLAGCAYCDVVRRLYLQPLRVAGRVPVRQVEMRSRAELLGPRAETTRGADLARQWKVMMAPTVLFLGPGGTELAPRLTGYSEDFYGGYLDDALAAARQRLTKTRA
jgi:thioredoxin-related protein